MLRLVIIKKQTKIHKNELTHIKAKLQNKLKNKNPILYKYRKKGNTYIKQKLRRKKYE